MKITFIENNHASWFEMQPETAKEVAQLFRMVKNTKSEKPELYLTFGSNPNEDVSCNVLMRKLKPESNKTSVSVMNY